MAINVAINPVDDTEMTIITGVVEKIIYKEKPDQFQNTHQASMVVDGTWVNMRLKVKEGYDPQVRFAEGKGPQAKWMTLNEGDTVKMVVKPNEWNGKTYYQVSSSGIKVTQKGEGKPPQQKASNSVSSGSVGYSKTNDGVLVGHALTIASQLLGDVSDSKSVIDLAKEVHVASIKLKGWYKEQHKNLSDYDIGATSGQAMKLVAKEGMSVNAVVSAAKIFLTDVVPVVTSYVKGEDPTPSEVAAAKPAAKEQSKPATKAAPKPQPKVVEPEPDFGDDDFDDDIPF
jgi:hypothetical protein